MNVSFPASEYLPNSVVFTTKNTAGVPLFVHTSESEACGIAVFDEMHDTELLVMYGDVDECSSMVRARWELDAAWRIPCDGSARFQEVTPKRLVVWLTSFDEQGARFFSLLAHELFHVAAFIGRRLGIPLGSDSEEWYAYHINFTMNAVIDCIGYNKDDG